MHTTQCSCMHLSLFSFPSHHPSSPPHYPTIIAPVPSSPCLSPQVSALLLFGRLHGFSRTVLIACATPVLLSLIFHISFFPFASEIFSKSPTGVRDPPHSTSAIVNTCEHAGLVSASRSATPFCVRENHDTFLFLFLPTWALLLSSPLIFSSVRRNRLCDYHARQQG